MRFLYNAPAILHKGAVIVGDTHFGMEEKLRRRGIYDSGFSMRLYERLKGLVAEHRAKRVIFLGDVKEDITMLDRRTGEILSRLSMLCEVVIVRGNHDGGIEAFDRARLAPSGGLAYEGLGLVHGHSWPAPELMMCDHLVMGHQHPMVCLTDAFGKRHTEPAWLIAEPDAEMIAARYEKFNKKMKLILMPAFNPLVGSAINIDDNERLGPILNNKLFKLNRALVFRLDGTCLGKLENIL
jgi:putative SbcD/Mre11-related phosphoesterase